MGDIGEKICKRRKELGLTLEEVGEAVGVGKSTVRKWENGMIKNMGSDKITKLAEKLNMKPVELVPADNGVLFTLHTAKNVDPEEKELIDAWRSADEYTKGLVRRALHMEEKKDTSQSEISHTY